MYPFPPRTCSASRATCVAVSAEKRIAAAHSLARSPFELQPPETGGGDGEGAELEILCFFASALVAAE